MCQTLKSDLGYLCLHSFIKGSIYVSKYIQHKCSKHAFCRSTLGNLHLQELLSTGILWVWQCPHPLILPAQHPEAQPKAQMGESPPWVPVHQHSCPGSTAQQLHLETRIAALAGTGGSDELGKGLLRTVFRHFHQLEDICEQSRGCYSTLWAGVWLKISVFKTPPTARIV